MVNINNVDLTDDTNNKIHPETSIDQVHDKLTGKALDDILKELEIKADIGFQTGKSNTFYRSFKDLGITRENITIDQIVAHLPPYSTVIHSKTNGDGYNNDIFPSSSGLLVVAKGSDGRTVNFTFDNQNGSYKGYFNSYYKDERRWTGWNKIEFRISTFEQIGLTGGSETIKDIYSKLPDHHSLSLTISGAYGNHSIYPQTTGILEVSKNTTRASFTFHHEEGYYVGLYNNNYPEDNNKWRGWANLYPSE